MDELKDSGVEVNPEDALSLAIERDAEIESGVVKPLSHDELMKLLRAPNQS